MPTFKLNSSHLNVSIFERNGNSLNGILKKTLAEPWELAKFIKQNFLNDVDKLKNSAEVDHIKVHYGALSIFNAIYKKYYWTSEATALKLYIPFLHSIEDAVKVIRMMKEEHEEYSPQRVLSSATKSRTSLNTLLKLNI
ncbi:hypothetical protein BCV71DRAFT_238623 [Rhizopus microsporus]|uniref:Uncharacterized protein n=1 Tax=Rhizopus microsporus TaxID=58291 RepID=A0A1X0RQA3_RHIZD|nr:hypothetical protein BCV71DRAFT_238623 [Rhizopus microsporus]